MYLGRLLHNDAGTLGDGVGHERGFGGGQDELRVGLDHGLQVFSGRLAAVVHRDLI